MLDDASLNFIMNSDKSYNNVPCKIKHLAQSSSRSYYFKNQAKIVILEHFENCRRCCRCGVAGAVLKGEGGEKGRRGLHQRPRQHGMGFFFLFALKILGNGRIRSHDS